MSRLFGMLLPLIGYTCVATVISAGMGYGYLRQSGKIDDEKMFRVVALLQDVNLEEIQKETAEKAPEVDGEEPSFEEQQRHAQTAMLHFDAKQKQLAVSLVNFDYQLKQLNAAIENYARIKGEVSDYLDAQGKLVLSEAMQDVREQFEQVRPKEAKTMLIKYIEDNSIDEVIMLLSGMKPKTSMAILKTFTDEKELEMLYRIQRKMLTGDPTRTFIDEKLKALEQLKAQDK